MDCILKAGGVILPDRVLENGAVRIKDGRIDAVGTFEEVQQTGLPVIDWGEAYLSPAFIDMHIHGCFGRVSEESAEAVTSLSQYLVTTGTGSFLATAMTAGGLKNARAAMRAPQQGAAIRGIYMEGPFLSPRKLAGAEGSDKDLVAPSVEALDALLGPDNGGVVAMGLGAELEGAAEVMEALKKRGILVSAAHTKAGYDDIERAKAHGLTHATHLYNVMSGLHHRRPGVVGAVLTDDDLTTELICDGVHVHPAAIELAIRCKGVDSIAMITDMTLGGLPDGDYDNGTLQIEVRDNVARFKGVDPDADHAIVGSTRPMLAGIKTVTVDCKRPIYEAVRMASLTPARILGLGSDLGSIEVGKVADLCAFSRDFKPLMTMLGGEIAYRA